MSRRELEARGLRILAAGIGRVAHVHWRFHMAVDTALEDAITALETAADRLSPEDYPSGLTDPMPEDWLTAWRTDMVRLGALNRPGHLSGCRLDNNHRGVCEP